DTDVRVSVVGLMRGTTKSYFVRATLESLAYQTKDVLDVMINEAGLELKSLRVDGGAVTNDFLMQIHSDILGVPVERPVIQETTDLGAAYLAGLADGLCESKEENRQDWEHYMTFTQKMEAEKQKELYEGWKKAVHATREFK